MKKIKFSQPNPHFKGVKPTRLTAMEVIMKHWEKITKELHLHISSFSTPYSKTDLADLLKKKRH